MSFYLLKKLSHPFIYPPIFKDSESLLADLKNKHNQPEEVRYFVDEIHSGLTEFEEDLVNGPMRKRGYILDVGCGAGREAIALTKLGFKIKAIDISEAMIQAAREEAKKEGLGIEFEELSIIELEDKNRFDYCLFSSGVYNSIPTRELRQQVVRGVMCSLKPEGSLFIPIGIRGKRKLYSRECLIDAMRWILNVFLGGRIKTEVGDALIDKITPLSNNKIKIFHHFFSSFKQIQQELIDSGFGVRQPKPGLWQLNKLVNHDTYSLNWGRNSILKEKAIEIFEEFKKKDIDFLLIKGIYLGFSVYPDMGLRPMADTDLLMKKNDLNKVAEVLNRLGFSEISPRAQRDYGCDATFCSQDKIYIDIHWDICQYERFKWIIDITSDFWERKAKFSLNGIEVETLSVEDHILYVALHYALFDLLDGTNGIYDLFYLIDNRVVDWKKIIHNADKYGIKIPLYYSLLKASELTDLKLPDFVLGSLKPHSFKKALLDYFLRRHTTSLLRYPAQALMLDNFWDTLRVLGRTFKAIPRSHRNARRLLNNSF